MLSRLSELARNAHATAIVWDSLRIRPEMRSREVRLTLAIAWVLLFFAALFMSLGADLTSAQSDAAETGSATSQGGLPPQTAEAEEHGLPQKAVEIARPLGFPITNSMVVSWIVAVGLIVFARVATRDMQHVPRGAQNLLEWLVGGLYDFWKALSAPIWSSGRSGFLPQFSFSFSLPIGWASFPESVRSGGDIRLQTVS